jgi:hypothetical protein
MSFCEFNATLAGIGNFVVASATANHVTPENNGVIDGKTYVYYANSYDTSVPPRVTAWEAGSGPYTVLTHTQARTTIIANSNGDANPVNFPTPPVVDVFPSPYSPLEAPVGVNFVVFESRAAAAAANISSSINSILVKAYAAGYPVEPAVYTRVGSSNPLLITDAGGGNWGVTSAFVYPEYFGAKRDGATDDAPAIRAAAAYFGTLGITGAIRSRNGIYFLNTIATNGFMDLLPGVSLIGEGPNTIFKIKGAGSAANFLVAAPKDLTAGGTITGVEYKNFTIDGNGVNNISALYVAGIYIPYGKNIDIDNVTVQNFGGSQPMAIGSNAGLNGMSPIPTASNLKITNCKFYEIGTALNPLCTDFSCIYVVALDSIITKNRMVNTVQDAFGTGIELHGTGICNNNVIIRMRQGFNIGSYPDTFFVIDGNYLDSVYGFGTIWNGINDTIMPFTLRIFSTIAIISNNHCIQLDASKMSLIDAVNETHDGSFSSIKVSHNHFRSIEAFGGTNIFPIIAGGKIRNMEITDNTAIGFAGQFYMQSLNPEANCQILTIDRNVIIDCCTTINGSFKTAITVNGTNALALLSVNENKISNTGTIYMTTGISGNIPMQVTLGNGRVAENRFYNVTTAVNWTGTGTMTFV